MVEIKGGRYIGYGIFMRKGDANATLPWHPLTQVAAETQTYVVKKLIQGTKYAFKVCGRLNPGSHTICSTPLNAITPPIGQFHEAHY